MEDIVVKQMKKMVVITAVVVGSISITLASVLTFKSVKSKAMENDVQSMIATETLEKRDLQKSISVAGTLVSAESYSLTSEVTDVEIKEVKVKVGDYVHKGDVIAILDSEGVEKQLAMAKENLSIAQQKKQLELKAAQREYENAISESNVQQQRANEELSDAQQKFEKAVNETKESQDKFTNSVEDTKKKEAAAKEAKENEKKSSEKLKNKERELSDAQRKLDDKKAAVEEAKSDYQSAQDELGKHEEPTKPEGEDTESEEHKEKMSKYEKEKASYEDAKQKVDQAKEKYEKLQKECHDAQDKVDSLQKECQKAKDKEEESAKAKDETQNAYDEAKSKQSELQSQVKQNESTMESTQNTFDKAQDNVEDAKHNSEKTTSTQKDNLQMAGLTGNDNISLEQEVEKYEKLFEKCVVKAPADGRITALSAKAGQIYKGNEIALIQKDEDLQVLATVDQYDISDVAQGMNVQIKTTTTGEEVIFGEIAFVSPVPKTQTSEKEKAQTMPEYEILASMKNKNERLRIGMTAKLTVIEKEEKDTFAVSEACLHTDDAGNYYIEVLEQETRKPIAVTVGLKTDYYVAIASDELKEGMQVIADNSEVSDYNG